MTKLVSVMVKNDLG